MAKRLISWFKSLDSIENEQLTHFINSWMSKGEQNRVDIEKCFESIVYNYKNKAALSEKILQSYLYLNRTEIFPICSDLLIYERSLWEDRTDLGKVDMVFGSKKKLLVIETKFFDLTSSGSNQCEKRRKHRKKVINQVLKVKKQIVNNFHIPEEYIICAVFTNDCYHIDSRAQSHEVISKRVNDDSLRDWVNNYKFKILQPEEYEMASFYEFKISRWPSE